MRALQTLCEPLCEHHASTNQNRSGIGNEIWKTMMCVRQTRTNDVNKSGKPVLRDDKGRWLHGSGSPSPGRPPSSRQKISEKLLADLAGVWEVYGRDVLERLAIEEPAKLAQIAYGLLPRDLFISVEQKTPGNLEPEA